jgi:hypothetical protein
LKPVPHEVQFILEIKGESNGLLIVDEAGFLQEVDQWSCGVATMHLHFTNPADERITLALLIHADEGEFFSVMVVAASQIGQRLKGLLHV